MGGRNISVASHKETLESIENLIKDMSIVRGHYENVLTKATPANI